MSKPIWVASAIALWLVPAAKYAAAQSKPAQADEPARLVFPSLGRPAFLRPGETLRIVAQIPSAAPDGELSVELRDHAGRSRKLAAAGVQAEQLAAGNTLSVRIPPNLPHGTYDLLIHTPNHTVSQPHAVCVGRFDGKLRVVHLSNLNLGGLTTPLNDDQLRQLVDEVNLVSPSVIIATGDYLDSGCRDVPHGWRMLAKFFSSFDAPVILAAGDQDSMEQYSRYFAASAVGVVPIGAHRVLVLYDHPGALIENDPDQIQWIQRTLLRPGFDGVTVVASHNQRPGLLEHWRAHGELARMVHAARLGVWLSGGHRDWDGLEYADLIEAASPMIYARTHQASPAIQGGADGRGHYRILDIDGDRAIQPGGGRIPPSQRLGSLHATLDGPNDGSQTQLKISAVNALPYRVNDLSQFVRLRKSGEEKPWCHGGELVQVDDRGEMWEIRVRFDLPDRGAAHIVVGVAAEPIEAALDVSFSAPAELNFTRKWTDQALAFQQAQAETVDVVVRNIAPVAARFCPIIRLDGGALAFRPLDGDARLLPGGRVLLDPGGVLRLRVDLSAVRVRPGNRELQFYADRQGAVTPVCKPLRIRITGKRND